MSFRDRRMVSHVVVATRRFVPGRLGRSGTGSRRAVAVAMTAVAVAGACGDGDAPGAAAVHHPEPTSDVTTAGPLRGEIVAYDQVGDGTAVEVAGAAIHGGPGFVVVHQEDKGGPGPVVGHAAIPEGRSTGVAVPADHRLEAGAYWVMLHRDADAVGTYQWPGPDGPVRAPAGLAYVERRILVQFEQKPGR